MFSKLFLAVVCSTFVFATAIYDFKYAYHGSWVSKRCRGVLSDRCCPRAGPCAITYYMRYYRNSLVDACRKTSNCNKHCGIHLKECRQNCDAAMTYRDRRASTSDKCKCEIDRRGIRTLINRCYARCKQGYNSCVSGCKTGPVCPIRVITSVYFNMSMKGECARYCAKCGPGSITSTLKGGRKLQCKLSAAPKSVTPSGSRAESDASIQSRFS